MRHRRPLNATQWLLAVALACASPYVAAQDVCIDPSNAAAGDTETRPAGKPAAAAQRNPNAPAHRGAGEAGNAARQPRWQSFVPGMFR